MPADITKLTWWVQLVDCTTFENWKEMLDVVTSFAPDGNGILGYDWDGPMPESISFIGTELPMEMDELAEELSALLMPGEYIIFAEFIRGDVLDHKVITYYAATDDAVVVLDGTKVVMAALSTALETS